MQEEAYTQIETEYGGIKVVMRFPGRSNNQEGIRSEVEQILSGLLLEQAAQFM